MNQSTQATNTRLQSPLGRLREKPLHIRAMFLYVTCTLIMTTGTVAGIQLALPAIMEEFDVPVTTAVWVSIAYFVVIPGVTVAIGGITTFFEQRGLAVMGLVVDLLLMAAVFFTHNIYLFIVIRFLSSAFRIFPWLTIASQWSAIVCAAWALKRSLSSERPSATAGCSTRRSKRATCFTQP